MKLFVISVILLIFNYDKGLTQNSSYDYSIEQQINCNCDQSGDWVALYVKADSIVKAIRISDSYQLTIEESASYKSINELFEEVSRYDTTTWEVSIVMDTLNSYPSYLEINQKPIIHGDTITIIEDAYIEYSTRNYRKN